MTTSDTGLIITLTIVVSTACDDCIFNRDLRSISLAIGRIVYTDQRCVRNAGTGNIDLKVPVRSVTDNVNALCDIQVVTGSDRRSVCCSPCSYFSVTGYFDPPDIRFYTIMAPSASDAGIVASIRGSVQGTARHCDCDDSVLFIIQ